MLAYLRGRLVFYFSFARQCLALLADQKAIFVVFLVLSVAGALTEGITISLLVPLLQTQGGGGGLAATPVLGTMSKLFAGFSPAGRIEAVAIAMAGVIVLRNLLQYAVAALGAVIPLRLEQKLNLRSYDALMAVEIAYIHEHDYGDMLNGVGGWSQRVTTLLTNVATMLWSLLIIAIYVGMMLLLSWRLTLLATAFLLATSLLLRWLSSGPLQRAGEMWTAAATHVNQVAMESISGMKIVRLAGGEEQMRRGYARAVEAMNLGQRRAAMIYVLNSPLLSTIAGLFICALLIGTALLHRGEPAGWISSILLFLFLLFRLMGPVSDLNAARSRVAVNVPVFELLNQFYRETASRRQPNGTKPATPLRTGIVLERVSFAYKPGERNALTDVSLAVERSRMVAVVGPSGAGKSTLVALIARLYDPQRGRVLVDGVDLRELEVRSWRRRLAVVTQENAIFNASVADNIRFGRGEVPLAQIEAAARLAAAEDFIAALPQGYDTLLGDRGVRLSGGQQQRIAIARAVLAEPDLLILDEATSHLDTFTERAIQNAVENIAHDRTVLVIAHRLSTIRRADTVIVMDGGRIVEFGRHEELLARRRAYWEMVEHQRLDLVEEAAN